MLVAEINKISYWNEYARWYKLWREHNNYHEPIKSFLLKFTKPGMKVLDIGAGDGILSFPLVEHGCSVTALEPSQSMQSYLLENARKNKIPISIDSRRFEELDCHEISKFDLALACNSLHLTEYGIEGSLTKFLTQRLKMYFLLRKKYFPLKSFKVFILNTLSIFPIPIYVKVPLPITALRNSFLIGNVNTKESFLSGKKLNF